MPRTSGASSPLSERMRPSCRADGARLEGGDTLTLNGQRSPIHDPADNPLTRRVSWTPSYFGYSSDR